jgi:recombination protein RecT
MTDKIEPGKKQEMVPTEPTLSERFTGMVLKEFAATMGDVTKFTDAQRRLAQHLYVKIDAQLNALEAKRIKDGKLDQAPIIWANINMQKLALDAMHRIELGLDALIPNHIHPIPYFNGKIKKYDLDLRIGYVGKDYYRRTVTIEQPLDIRYELVYSKDKFVVHKQDSKNDREAYEFEISDPFDRGEIVGGFGYIVFDDARKNKLVIVTEKDFERSERQGNRDFWAKNPTEMRYKTIITRVTDKLQIDPKKISESYVAVEEQEAVAEIEAEIEANANKGNIIDVETEPRPEDADQHTNGGMTPEDIADALAKEKAEAEAEAKQRKGPGF